MKRLILALITAGAMMSASLSAHAGVDEAVAFFRTVKTWKCAAAPEYVGGFETTSYMAMHFEPGDRIVMYERVGAVMDDKVYNVWLRHEGDLAATAKGFSIRNTRSVIEEADTLPNGGQWGDASTLTIALDLNPQTAAATSYAFRGWSRTSFGKMSISCYPYQYH